MNYENMTFAQLVATLEGLEAKNAELHAKLDEANRRLEAAGGVPTAPVEEPLKVYPDFESIEWVRYPDTDATRKKFNDSYMQSVFLGVDWKPPYRNVMVENVGEVRYVNSGWDAEKRRGGLQMADWYAIGMFRVPNVIGRPWVAIVQPGDNAQEEDPEDQKVLIQKYSGGLRYPLSSWDNHAIGAKFKEWYLETHDDPGVEYRQRNPSSLSAYGN